MLYRQAKATKIHLFISGVVQLTIITEEIVFALQNESKVDVVVPPGISLTATGAGNFGAPVISQGYTTEYKECNGIIR